MRIAIIGRTEILFDSAERLAAAGHQIGLILTSKEAPEYKKSAEDFRKLADLLDAVFIQTPRIEEALETIRNLPPMDIGVSLNYSGVIPQTVIDLFRLGILNAHGGDLPRYRGNACQAWSIVNGEDHIGLCIHRMIGGELDSGDIISRDFYPISEHTRISEVWKWMEQTIPILFQDALSHLQLDANYVIECQSKDLKDALRCYPRLPQDCFIDWHQDAAYISKVVRASSEPYGGAYTYLNGKRLTIWRSRVEEFTCKSLVVPGQIVWRSPETGEVGVATANGVLVLEEIQVEYGERGRPADWLKSLRTRLGVMVVDEIIDIKKRLDLLEQSISKTREQQYPAL